MKTAEECLKTIELKFAPHPFGFNRSQRELIKSVIRGIQKEAYNQAIDDAVKNAEAKIDVWYDYDARAYQRGDVIVDRNSILKLKK